MGGRGVAVGVAVQVGVGHPSPRSDKAWEESKHLHLQGDTDMVANDAWNGNRLIKLALYPEALPSMRCFLIT